MPNLTAKNKSPESGFNAPPWTDNSEGGERRVGVEMEMAGIEPEIMAKAVTATLGGTVQRESAFYTRVVDTELGDFDIELDADLLTSRKYQQHLSELGIEIGEGERRENIESVISRVAGLVVPLELVAPPIPWSRLEGLDAIRRTLHEAGARGTHGSPVYAFGLHLNIEAASLKADHLLAMLRAFLLKYDWLLEQSDIDLTRRISPYIHPFPEDYVVHIMQRKYRPGIRRLIDDYLKFTPTRNRPLDMLPLFAQIDRKRVMAADVETELIKPRPAFHYRLPNCLIDEADWSLAKPLNDWVEVERLAADSSALEAARAERLADASVLRSLIASAFRWVRS
jgi:hypothetical protein